MPMARNHVLHAAEVGSLGVAAGLVDLRWSAPALVLGAGLFHWGATAPDLDSEGSVASSTWAPALVRSFHDGRLRPNPRSLLRYLVPGSHTLSAFMRLLARWWYQETRAAGDDPRHVDAHRMLWHTGPGAVVMAGVVALLLSPVPAEVALALLRVSSPGADAYLAARPLLEEVAWRGFAAVPAGLMFGVAATAWNRRWKWPAVWVGAGAAVLCGQGLASWWWVWALAVYAGCYVHVAGDRCSMHGCPRWWTPFVASDGEQKKWAPTGWLPRWARFRTGGGGEALFTLATLGVWAVAMWLLLSLRLVLPASVDVFG